MTANAKPIAIGIFAAMAAIPFAMQAPAQAAACPLSTNSTAAPTNASMYATYATVFSTTTPFSCTLGDKIFKNFSSPNADLAAMSGRLRFWWDTDVDNPMNYLMRYGVTSTALPFAVSSSGVTTSFNFNVKVDNTIPGAALAYISDYALDRTGGSNPSNANTSTMLTGTTVAGGAYPTELAFTSTATLKQNSPIGTPNTRVFTITVTQSDVPGPLPILGAGLAFGYSRKLRNRVRLHA